MNEQSESENGDKGDGKGGGGGGGRKDTIEEPIKVLWNNCKDGILSPSTKVNYIGQNCSLVFVIDMTPSMMQVVRETCMAAIFYTHVHVEVTSLYSG